MTKILSNTERLIPILRSFVDKLISLSRKILEPDYQDIGSDHCAHMALLFVRAQVEHLESIVVLNDAEQGRDAEIIARCMTEGMCLLLWAAKEPLERPFLWRSFIYVQDFRLLEEKKKKGEKIDPKIESHIRDNIKTYGDVFLTKEWLKAKNQGKPLEPKRYQKNWYKKSVSEIYKDIKGDILFKYSYQIPSQWIHWSPYGLESAMNRTDNIISYSSRSPNAQAKAFNLGFQALIVSLKLLDSRLKLGHDDSLDELKNSYIKAHQNRKTNPSPNEIMKIESHQS